MSDLPVRTNGIEINEVSDGLVVYQRERDRVHYLNETAGLVLDMCTGNNTEASIASSLQAVYELPRPPATEVASCLAQLRDEGLIS